MAYVIDMSTAQNTDHTVVGFVNNKLEGKHSEGSGHSPMQDILRVAVTQRDRKTWESRDSNWSLSEYISEMLLLHPPCLLCVLISSFVSNGCNNKTDISSANDR